MQEIRPATAMVVRQPRSNARASIKTPNECMPDIVATSTTAATVLQGLPSNAASTTAGLARKRHKDGSRMPVQAAISALLRVQSPGTWFINDGLVLVD